MGFDPIRCAIYAGCGGRITKVVGSRQGGIHKPTPTESGRQRREFKGKRFPIGIEYDVDMIAGLGMMQAEGQAMRVVAPIRLTEIGAMPCDVRRDRVRVCAPKQTFAEKAGFLGEAD